MSESSQNALSKAVFITLKAKSIIMKLMFSEMAQEEDR